MEGFGITLFFPLLLQFITNSTGQKSQSQLFTNIFSTFGLSLSITNILIFLILLFIIKGFVLFGAGIYQSYLASSSVKKIRINILEGISDLDYGHYLLQNTGSLTNLVNNEISRILHFFIAFTRTFPFIASIVIFTFGLIMVDWRLAIFVLILTSLIFVTFRFVTVKIEIYSHKTSKQNSELSNKFVQFVQAFKYLISTNGFRRLKPKMYNIINNLKDLEYKSFSAFFITSAFSDPISLISLVMIMIFQLYVLHLPVAIIFVTILFLQRIMASVLTLQSQWQNCQSYAGSYITVTTFMNDLKSKQEYSGNENYSGFEREIRLDNISFAFGNQKILDSVNITINKNSMVAIVGESGAGKSTVANLITGILKPLEGNVSIDGNNLSIFDLHSYRETIGFIPQESVMFDDTIRNNISLWKNEDEKQASQEEIEYAASQALCKEFIEQFPEKYDTVAGDRGIRISGGQRQRIAIARELLKKPELLIMDEATSSLDSASEFSIRESIENLKGSVTLVVIAHRLSTIKNCDYIYVLDKGRVVEEGTYLDLRKNKISLFNKMCEVQNL